MGGGISLRRRARSRRRPTGRNTGLTATTSRSRTAIAWSSRSTRSGATDPRENPPHWTNSPAAAGEAASRAFGAARGVGSPCYRGQGARSVVRGPPYGRYKAYNSYMIPVSEAREQLADLVNRV